MALAPIIHDGRRQASRASLQDRKPEAQKRRPWGKIVSGLFYAAPSMLFFGAFIMHYRMEMIFAFHFIALLAECCTMLVLTSFVHMPWLAQLFFLSRAFARPASRPNRYILSQEFLPFRRGVFCMPEPKIAQKGAYPVAVEASKTYYWCACGRSANQPFCDGSHKGSEFTPMKYEAAESKTVYFCGCKHTATPCMCDGTHARL